MLTVNRVETKIIVFSQKIMISCRYLSSMSDPDLKFDVETKLKCCQHWRLQLDQYT